MSASPPSPHSKLGPGGDTENISPESFAQRAEPGMPDELKKEFTPLTGKGIIGRIVSPQNSHIDVLTPGTSEYDYLEIRLLKR